MSLHYGAGATGLEPATSRFEVWRSIQLIYAPGLFPCRTPFFIEANLELFKLQVLALPRLPPMFRHDRRSHSILWRLDRATMQHREGMCQNYPSETVMVFRLARGRPANSAQLRVRHPAGPAWRRAPAAADARRPAGCSARPAGRLLCQTAHRCGAWPRRL